MRLNLDKLSEWVIDVFEARVQSLIHPSLIHYISWNNCFTLHLNKILLVHNAVVIFIKTVELLDKRWNTIVWHIHLLWVPSCLNSKILCKIDLLVFYIDQATLSHVKILVTKYFASFNLLVFDDLSMAILFLYRWRLLLITFVVITSIINDRYSWSFKFVILKSAVRDVSNVWIVWIFHRLHLRETITKSSFFLFKLLLLCFRLNHTFINNFLDSKKFLYVERHFVLNFFCWTFKQTTMALLIQFWG